MVHDKKVLLGPQRSDPLTCPSSIVRPNHSNVAQSMFWTPYVINRWSRFLQKAKRTPWYSPKGLVPVLRLNNSMLLHALNESTVIMDFLKEFISVSHPADTLISTLTFFFHLASHPKQPNEPSFHSSLWLCMVFKPSCSSFDARCFIFMPFPMQLLSRLGITLRTSCGTRRGEESNYLINSQILPDHHNWREWLSLINATIECDLTWRKERDYGHEDILKVDSINPFFDILMKCVSELIPASLSPLHLPILESHSSFGTTIMVIVSGHWSGGERIWTSPLPSSSCNAVR